MIGEAQALDYMPEACRRLVAAVLWRAVRDARDGNGHQAGAVAFLRSPQGRALLVEFDLLGDPLARVCPAGDLVQVGMFDPARVRF